MGRYAIALSAVFVTAERANVVRCRVWVLGHGARVLRGMPGAGPAPAALGLQAERLDPRGEGCLGFV